MLIDSGILDGGMPINHTYNALTFGNQGTYEGLFGALTANVLIFNSYDSLPERTIINLQVRMIEDGFIFIHRWHQIRCD